MKLVAMVTALGILLPGIVGCGSACESWCEDTLDCLRSQVDDDTLEDAKADCDEACDDMEEQAEDADCEDDFDEYMDCVDEEGVDCDSPTCVSKQNAYLTCLGRYCSSHPSTETCGVYD